jgi:hypothetical protein
MLDFPNSPTNGQTYVGPGNVLWQFDGVKWLASQGGGGIFVVISDTAPPNPAVGTFWWDSTAAQLFLRYYDGNSVQWVQANSLTADVGATVALAQNNTGRNLLHNPYFNIAQRGAGPWTTNNVYTLDRWKTGSIYDTFSFTKQALADADRTAIGDEAAEFCLQDVFTGSATASSTHAVFNPIEDSRRLSGKTVIFSFWAKASVALQLAVNMAQGFGTGGSPSGGIWVLPTGTAIPITTTWQRYSTTLAVPSTAGKTFGTNNDSSTAIYFSFSAAGSQPIWGNIGVQSGTVQLWGVQLEFAAPGQTAPSPLEKIDPGEDLRRCQRFFENFSLGGDYTSTLNAPYLWRSYRYAVTKRAMPTVTPASMYYFNTAGQAVAFTATVYQAYQDYCAVGANNLGTGATGIVNGQITVSADL